MKKYRSTLLGQTTYVAFDWFVPKTGLQFAVKGIGDHSGERYIETLS